MKLIERIRRLRRDRARMLFIAQAMGSSSEIAALTWMNRHAPFGMVAMAFQLIGLAIAIMALQELCLEFPSIGGYWPSMLVNMGIFVLTFWLLCRYREVWVLMLSAFYLAFAVVLFDFAVANVRTPQVNVLPVVDSTCYTPLRGRSQNAPRQVCELKVQQGLHGHWIDVTGSGLWMSAALTVEIRRGFLGLTYPRLAPVP